ncbi:hypothetical protein A0H81_06660 [Grifola frondosa]|uniref:Methyltransferase domain-containing protein n=1 Tax=Grifola frondosa TaxID=5627 RepID=A0A1C7M954_GRIFR|nr:hypothetical protein A0H81_06660 [Grifola frondosa]
MGSVIQRHPRSFIVLAILAAGTLFLLLDHRPYYYHGRFPDMPHDPTLAGRVEHSEEIYQNMLMNRQEFIKKMGPKPEDLALFPQMRGHGRLTLLGTSSRLPSTAHMRWSEWARLEMVASGCCGLSRVETKRDCVVYSVGINYESSFEAEILTRTRDCEIWGYDFSVTAFGPEISKGEVHRTHFFPYFLAGTDSHGEDDTPKRYTLESLMRMNGHTHIDILKVDIESWEFETLSALIQPYITSGRPLPFAQLQLEIHLYGKTFASLLEWWEMLEKAGLRPFMTEPNLVYLNYNRKAGPELAEYSFLNIKSKNIFLADPESTHPRYSIALALICGVAFFILCFPDSAAHLHQYKDFTLRDPSLKNRVKRAEQKYQKVLQDRHVFIEKMGPKPQDLVLFPPDREPWPPYTAWDFFPAAFNCPHEMERIGAFGDGGKWVCGLSRLENMPDCVIYSVGGDPRTHSALRGVGYDYSVNSFGPEITKSQLLRAHFHPFFLAGTDAHGENDEPKRYTLESLMRMNGHNHIDILKVDIESWDLRPCPRLFGHTPLPFAQLQLEIHLYEKTFPDLLKWWEMLEEAGLRPFMTEVRTPVPAVTGRYLPPFFLTAELGIANYNRFKKGTPDLAEYSFLNIKGNNIFIGNPVPPRGSSSGANRTDVAFRGK